MIELRKEKKLEVLLRKNITQPTLFHCRMFVRSKYFNFMIHTIKKKRGWAHLGVVCINVCLYAVSLSLFFRPPRMLLFNGVAINVFAFMNVNKRIGNTKRNLFYIFSLGIHSSTCYWCRFSSLVICRDMAYSAPIHYVLGTDSELIFFFFYLSSRCIAFFGPFCFYFRIICLVSLFRARNCVLVILKKAREWRLEANGIVKDTCSKRPSQHSHPRKIVYAAFCSCVIE